MGRKQSTKKPIRVVPWTRSQTDGSPKKRNKSAIHTLNWLRETLCTEKTQSMTVPPPETPRNRKWRQMKEDADVGNPCWFFAKKILLGTIFCQCAARQKRLSEQQELKAQEAVLSIAPRSLRGFKHGIPVLEQTAYGRTNEHFRRTVQKRIKDGNTGWRYKYVSLLDRWKRDAEYLASVTSRTCYKGRCGNMVRFDPQPRQEA